jgi:hypothetical protein
MAETIIVIQNDKFGLNQMLWEVNKVGVSKIHPKSPSNKF